VLNHHGSSSQKKEWLEELKSGAITSCFVKDDSISIKRKGKIYILNGSGWILGSFDESCKLIFVSGITDFSAPSYRQHSIILVPYSTPGFNVHESQFLGTKITFEKVKVHASNLIGDEGLGFSLMNERYETFLHNRYMRFVSLAERSLELLCKHSKIIYDDDSRPLCSKGSIIKSISDSRIEIDQCRMSILQTSHLIDHFGIDSAKILKRYLSVVIKIVPDVVIKILNRSLQIYRGNGLDNDIADISQMMVWTHLLKLNDGQNAEEIIANAELLKCSL
jgi:acyl-CoA dehydrogenase